jgi:hypothetical protein
MAKWLFLPPKECTGLPGAFMIAKNKPQKIAM